MTFPCIHRLLHEGRRLIGSALARFRLHHIRFDNRNGQEVVIKTRPRGSDFAVLMGNMYLLLDRSDVEVLSNKEWLRWEIAVKTAMNADGIGRTGSTAKFFFAGKPAYRQQMHAFREPPPPGV